jgi:hypothetical protein
VVKVGVHRRGLTMTERTRRVAILAEAVNMGDPIAIHKDGSVEVG